MTLKVQLVKDNKVIVEMPLEREGWEKEALELELEEFESTIDSIAGVHGLFSNKVRVKMLSEMIRFSDRRFSEFMNILNANQKIVSENLRRLATNGLVERIEKKRGEVHYVTTDLGFTSVIACMVMHRILDELE